MKPPEYTIQEVMRRIGTLEQHVINLIIPIQNISEILRSSDVIREYQNLFSQPLKIDDSRLSVLLRDFAKAMEEFKEDISNLKSERFSGEIKFIGKRLNEIEKSVEDLKKGGIKKELQIHLTVDGKEMTKKALHQECIEPVQPTPNSDECLRISLVFLSDREQEILTARFGLFGMQAQTYEGMSKMFGISRERCSLIVRKIIRKLAHPKRRHIIDNMAYADLKKCIMDRISPEF